MITKPNKTSYENIYKFIKQIPLGHIATYGQVAKLAGIPRQARQVGYALSALRNIEVPWHRVVNAKGEISQRSNSDYEKLQRTLLEEEGIVFNSDGKISLTSYRWIPHNAQMTKQGHLS